MSTKAMMRSGTIRTFKRPSIGHDYYNAMNFDYISVFKPLNTKLPSNSFASIHDGKALVHATSFSTCQLPPDDGKLTWKAWKEQSQSITESPLILTKVGGGRESYQLWSTTLPTNLWMKESIVRFPSSSSPRISQGNSDQSRQNELWQNATASVQYVCH